MQEFNIPNLVEDFEPIEIGSEQDVFAIDTPEKADWAITKIKEDAQVAEQYIQCCESRITALKAEIEAQKQKHQRQTAYLMHKLSEFMATAPTKSTKTQSKLVLPSGEMIRKFATVKPVQGENLLETIEQTMPQFVEVTKKVKWGELKKSLTFDTTNKVAVNTETGEIIEGVEFEDIAESYSIK